MTTTSPYGTWKSPITTSMMVADTVSISGVVARPEGTFWLEGRPTEGGRNVIVFRSTDGTITDVIPSPFNARSRVHEYGGGAWLVDDRGVYFTNFADQQIYHVTPDGPQQLTVESSMRFADAVMDTNRNRLVCVAECHEGGVEPENCVVAVSLDDGQVTRLVRGADFYAAPRISPDGQSLVWLAWNHPNMPWDGTTLYRAGLDENGAPEATRVVAGGTGEAIQQPAFSPAGQLCFVSDESGWWNLYTTTGEGVRPVFPIAGEFGEAQWALGLCTYVFRSSTEVVCKMSTANVDSVGRLDLDSGEWHTLDLPCQHITSLAAGPDGLTFVGASATVQSRLMYKSWQDDPVQEIKTAARTGIAEGYVSIPEAIEFPTGNNEVAHAFFYAPANAEYCAPQGELPPLLVKIHGGPTSAEHASLNPATQFWTSRGIAVLDVNYRGSTGYGRDYRNRLQGNWGVTDVEDVCCGAEHLARTGRVDGNRLMIRGGSAGGYTTLAALALTDTFKAGTSLYGVGDLEALARDTHKFESRYLDSLIGPYPAERDTYIQRSPVNHIDGLSCPILFLQGLEDRIVPPNQAEAMVAALTAKGIPVAYVTFEGEQHGFRQADNIKRALDAELYFYGEVFGFKVADSIVPVTITNLPGSNAATDP